jgi:mono/diheme cytochrome c family protein
MRPFVSLIPPALFAAVALVPRGDVLGNDKPAGVRQVSYLREVRPILAQHCFQCHGPDEAARKAKLRLDLKDHAFAGRHGGKVIAPGKPDGSLVWERVAAKDDDTRMPPPGTEPLTAAQKATLKTWIEQGAKWEDHWAFVPPVKPAGPTVSDRKWARDPLDAFVLARLDKEGMRPESEATREAWLRRVSFDLTGLPPTPAELDAFLKDKAADAYEKQVDRLLASPRYGERQAQEWLDLARYADTSGYQNDTPRKVWKWREWVVNAYNANMPFNQFAVEGGAGGPLPHPPH